MVITTSPWLKTVAGVADVVAAVPNHDRCEAFIRIVASPRGRRTDSRE